MLLCSRCSNLAHMLAEHSFYVPDLASLTDAEGLVEHLMAKVVQVRGTAWVWV